MRRLIAIHQPNFFPWLGFFDKMLRADIFILMDNAQFPKTGGSWTNRVHVLVGRHPSWVGVPVNRNFTGCRTIARMEICNGVPWRKKFIGTLRTNYSKTRFYKETMSFLEPLICFETSSLSEFNIHAVSAIASLIHCEKKLIRGSSLEVEGAATALLISMTKAVGGDAYLCGNGATGYQEDHLFAEAGLDLIYQKFVHPSYPQYGTDSFVEGLSIIDAMMNVGTEGLSSLLSRERAS